MTNPRTAIERATRFIQSQQQDAGFWLSPGAIGPAGAAHTAIGMLYAGELSQADGEKVARWLGKQALPNGAFVNFPSSPDGDLGATAVIAAYLRKFDEAPEVAARAEEIVRRDGGYGELRRRMSLGDNALLYLCMLGAAPVDLLPDAPLYALATPPVERWFMRHFHGGIIMTVYAVRLLTVALRGGGGLLHKLERDRGLYWLTAFQNRQGSWNAWAPVTAMHLAALKAAGVRKDDPRVRGAVDWLMKEAHHDGDDMTYWNASDTQLWATMFSVHALLDAGVDAEEPGIAKARDWMLASQCTEPQSPHNHVHNDGPLTGGFAFRADNAVLPDSDDTGAALSVLAALRHHTKDTETQARLDDANRRALAWLLGMQNPDGGFSSYVTGLPGKEKGPLFLRPLEIDATKITTFLKLVMEPPRELGDPSFEDVTGRVLHGMGLLGLRKDHPAVARALAFLRTQQLDDGSFWGRWLTNYTAGTSYVIRGAVAVGERGPWLSRALDFLERVQQPSGAWGESVKSYREPSTKAQGEACAAVTGRVLCALIDGGRGDSQTVRRGVAWLLETQRAAGDWDGSKHVAAIYPPDTFYAHAPAGTYYPLWALALYERSSEVKPATTPAHARA